MRSRPVSRFPGRPVLSAVVTLVALAAAGCTTTVQRGPGAGVVAQLSVERFLQAANERDIESMGRLFGTADGPIWDTGSTFGCFFKKIGSWFGGTSCVKHADVEVRLDAIARVLEHEDYKVVREEPVAGRLNSATRIFVDLTVKGESVPDIPFVVVRAQGGQWLVEEVDLQKVMAGR
jgi:hypothetical protein